jgi:hypothetical protein
MQTMHERFIHGRGGDLFGFLLRGSGGGGGGSGVQSGGGVQRSGFEGRGREGWRGHAVAAVTAGAVAVGGMPSEGGRVVADVIGEDFVLVVGFLVVAGVVKGVFVRVVGVFAQRGVEFVAEDGDKGVRSLEHGWLWRLDGEIFGMVVG